MVSNTRKFVLTGLMTAMVFVLTFTIKIPIPFTSGYIHLGDSMIYLSVMILGPYFGAFAAGVGSMFADLIGGYAEYALPTLIIKSLMALMMGAVLSHKKKSVTGPVLSLIAVWIAFSSATLVYLRSQINKTGLENIASAIVGDAADHEALQHTMDVMNRLPVYLIAGVAVVILILAAAAFFLSRRGESGIFNSKAIIGMTAAGICMVMGYFLVESFMYTPIAAACSVPMNLIQFFGGLLAAGLFAPAVSKAKEAAS